MCLIKNIFRYFLHKLFYFLGFIYASLLGVKLGSGAKINYKANVKNAGFIGNATIGENVTLGKGTYINSGLIMNAIIGQYCSIAYNVTIGPAEHDIHSVSMSPYSPHHKDGSSSADLPTKMVVIDDEVWIGANVVILQGVKIGYGSVVAAGAVVTKDIPAMEIWGGVPAKKIKNRELL